MIEVGPTWSRSQLKGWLDQNYWAYKTAVSRYTHFQQETRFHWLDHIFEYQEIRRDFLNAGALRVYVWALLCQVAGLLVQTVDTWNHGRWKLAKNYRRLETITIFISILWIIMLLGMLIITTKFMVFHVDACLRKLQVTAFNVVCPSGYDPDSDFWRWICLHQVFACSTTN